MTSASSYHLYVGGDIAAATFTAAWMRPPAAPSAPLTLAQTPQGFMRLQQQLQQTGIAPTDILIVMEATRTDWVALAVTLHHAGDAVGVINPLQAHHFAKALLRRAQTDALAAQILAQLAAHLQPAAWTPPPDVYHQLRQRFVALRHVA